MAEALIRDPNQWRQIEHVFNEALERDPSARAAFVEQACGTDHELREEVESLLASIDDSAPFIESAIEDAAAYYLSQDLQASLPEGKLLAQYRVIRVLGSGGMGQVYLAEDTRLKRNVALKLLPPYALRREAMLRRFEQEARALCSLNHPNLLTVFDFCTVDGRSFLVTELVEGETLRQKLSAGPIDLETALDITRQVAAGLKAAHTAGVFHRDVKPENIMIRSDGCVKVLDFGIAKITEAATAGQGSDPAVATDTGSMLGTPRYMSPEQARGLPVDARTDIFSVGTVLYEMLAGRPAFHGDTHSDLIADILGGHPKPLARSVSGPRGALQKIVNRTLAKDPAQRYEGVDGLLADLDRVRKQQLVGTGFRTVYLRVLQFALIAALAIGGWLLVRRHGPAPGTPAPRALAVLPFRNLKPNADTDFLSFSLADEVITRLGYVKALVIRPSSAVTPYRDLAAQSQDLGAIASKLNAQLLLTGTYSREGERLHITAQLHSVSPESILWQNTWTVRYDNLLSVPDSIAQRIIQTLELQLGPDEKAFMRPERAVNSLAYEYYLRGVDLYAVSDFNAAITMLEKSVAIDPKYAPTWAALGRAYTTNASLQFGGRRDYRLAEQAYDNAMALNPTLPEPRVYMANLLTDTGRVEQAVMLLRVALRSSPNDAEAHWELGYAYRYGGMLQESLAECELARRLDPEVKINSSAFNTYLYLGEYEKFLKSLPPNDSPLLVFYHGLGSYYEHDFSNAITEFDRAFDLAPGLLPAQIGKSLSDGLKHQQQTGLARLHATEQSMYAAGVTDAEAMYKMAQAYALLGDSPDALRMLDHSVSGGFFCYPYISKDPMLGSLYPAPEFQRIVDSARERWAQFRERFAGTASAS